MGNVNHVWSTSSLVDWHQRGANPTIHSGPKAETETPVETAIAHGGSVFGT